MNLSDIIQIGYFDLHLHTTASDGMYSPAELVKKAHEIGLKTIAITDHDTLDGIEEAKQAGNEFGIQVIAGVELSTKYKGRNIDILGYDISVNTELSQVLRQMREGRKNRVIRIIEKFVDLGMPITLDDVNEFSQGDVIARPHIAKAIVKKGYVSDFQTVFDEYLADGKPCAQDKLVFSSQEAIKLIHRSNGKAVLAHPVLIHDEALVREMMQLEYDGIEVWHRLHNKEDQIRYQHLAKEFCLTMTGGSDFHNDEHQLGHFGLEWKRGKG